ncbi:MAG: hypothetical protein LR005_01305, partial [Candidatus Pacebacteria bacterium]|nr:hypothetical protein [Candidatus Paceibacterota bacterium]
MKKLFTNIIKSTIIVTVISFTGFFAQTIFAANFTTPFTTESNYTKDTEIEVSGGLGKLGKSPIVSKAIYKNVAVNGWNSGAVSADSFVGDGEITMEIQGDGDRMFGFSTASVNDHYNTINYVIHLSAGGTVYIFENGAHKMTIASSCVDGDILTVRRTGTQITYLHNGSLLYTSLTPISNSAPLFADISMYTGNASGTIQIKNAKMNDEFIEWTNVSANATVVETTASGAEYPIGTFSITKTAGNNAAA